MQVRCPGCREKRVRRDQPTFPFCSVECRDHDLSSWAEEKYRIAGPANSGQEEFDDSTETESL